MFKVTTRLISGPALGRAFPKARPTQRFLSTAPPHKQSRSWKSSAARWGLAGAVVYYYNTSSVFAEEPAYAVHAPPETRHEQETYPTIDSIAEQRRVQSRPQPTSQDHATTVAAAPDPEATATGSPEELEEEASQQGAFNEETGEINWDCPCLGGMAYGPCGEQFRAAFSCFVFSKEEPKGVDCIEHFKTMQNCFREHPDVYGSELDDDEEGRHDALASEGDATPVDSHPAPTDPKRSATSHNVGQADVEAKKPADEGPAKSAEGRSSRTSQSAPARSTQEIGSKPSDQSKDVRPAAPTSGANTKRNGDVEDAEDHMVPKAWHDGRDANTAK